MSEPVEALIITGVRTNVIKGPCVYSGHTLRSLLGTWGSKLCHGQCRCVEDTSCVSHPANQSTGLWHLTNQRSGKCRGHPVRTWIIERTGDIKTLVTPWWGSGWSSSSWWWWPWPGGRGWPSPASVRTSWSGGGRRSTWLVKLIRWQPLTFKSSLYICTMCNIKTAAPPYLKI